MSKDTMSLVEIVRSVAEKSGVQQKICKRVIEKFEEVVVENVKAGRRVVVTTFGAFYRRDRKGGVVAVDVHRGTDNPVEYGPKMQLAFKATKKLLDM